MSKTYYIFRHGETFYTKYRRGFYGFKIRSAHILDAGKPTIERMAKYLKTVESDHNATSAYPRCLETSQIVHDVTGKQFVIDTRLNEFLFETFGHMRSKLKNFIAEMEASEYETIVICTHGAIVKGFISLLTTGKFPMRKLFGYIPPGVLVRIKDGKIEQFDFNKDLRL